MDPVVLSTYTGDIFPSFQLCLGPCEALVATYHPLDEPEQWTLLGREDFAEPELALTLWQVVISQEKNRSLEKNKINLALHTTHC